MTDIGRICVIHRTPLPDGYGRRAPYVLAGRHPGGALSVGTLPQLDAAGRQTTPPVEIVLRAALPRRTPLAIFGAPRTVVVPVSDRVDDVRVSNLSAGEEVRIKPTMVEGCLSLDLPTLYGAHDIIANPHRVPEAGLEPARQKLDKGF